MLIVLLLGLITALVCLSQIISFRRLYNYVEAELRFFPDESYTPKISVILPCKGLDPGFQDNIVQLLDQEYRSPATGRTMFEVIFAVATPDDPAYPVLLEISERKKLVKTKIVVAGLQPKRSQKINNQLHALTHVADDTEVFVFVDSDVIARPDFLRYLVARLENQQIGVTTGYRFYIPFKGDWASLLRSLWNRMSAWEMASPRYAFAWGGAMAIRRSTFELAKVAGHWDCAADDDLSLTTAIKDIGLTVHFVPQCLVASNGDGSLAEIIEWTNRQLILTKVYFRGLWCRAITRATIMAIWLVAMMVALVEVIVSAQPSWLLAVGLGLLILPIEVLFLAKAHRLWHRVLPDNAQYLKQSFLGYCLAIPLAHLILPWLTLYSVLTNRIQWRGVTYELKGPNEILVISNV